MSPWREFGRRLGSRARIAVEKVDKQIDKVVSRQRDRTNPSRQELRPASAKRANDATPTPRDRAKPQRIRSGFRSARSTVSRRIDATTKRPTGTAHGFTAVKVSFKFSKRTKEKNLSAEQIGGSHLIDRWAAIEAETLPEDDDTKVPPTQDEMDELEREAMDEIQQWGRTEEASISEPAQEERDRLHRQANELDDQAGGIARTNPEQATVLQRQAEQLRERAFEIAQQAQQAMNHIADQVRDRRAEARAELRREYEARKEEYDQRIEDLKDGLDKEKETAVLKNYFEEEKPEIESVELTND